MILHIAEQTVWKACAAEGAYRADSLESHGFIHCSLPEQVVAVANRFYRGRTDLVLVCIDETRVESKIRFEEGEPGERFPHIYGPLNLAAVVEVLELHPGDDGTFSLPEPLKHGSLSSETTRRDAKPRPT